MIGKKWTVGGLESQLVVVDNRRQFVVRSSIESRCRWSYGSEEKIRSVENPVEMK
jgi:hypothetical protein